MQSGTGDGTESRRAANLALYHWNLIILVYPRVTLLSCAFEHFTRHLERSALCSRSMKLAADQQDETTRAATSHRMFVRTSISLDIACRAMSDCTSPCAFRACLLAADAADGFIHARACDVTHYTTRSRSEAFSSLPELSR